MEQDPVFKELVRKSHILRKIDNIEIPLIRKQPSIIHHGITTFILSSTIHLLIYPLDTIKNRLISKSKVDDVARFNLNKVQSISTYIGIFRGYAVVMVGSLFHLAIGKQNMVLGCIAEAVAKTWIEISKVSKQMGNHQGDMQIMKKSYPLCLGYGLARDLIYRGVYINLMIYYQKKQAASRFQDQRNKMNMIYISTIIATILSHPFDVCFTKIASQRSFKYTNLLQIPITIVKQQSISKLLLSGFWARMSYNLIAMLILSSSYDNILFSTLQAY